MKVRLVLSSIVSFTLLFSSQCKKDKGDPLSQLPPATQTGANTFGCLVNGEVFMPKGKSGSITPIYQCYYEFLYPGSSDGYVFRVSASHKGDKECEVGDISLGTDSLSIHEGLIYKLRRDLRGKASGQYIYFPDCYTLEDTYKTNDISNGELTITKFDEVHDIVSGTFWFTAVNASGDTVKVTNGRFDMKFTR